MPLFYQQNINQYTRLAVWKIEEAENFFSQTVPLQTPIHHTHKRLQHFAGRYLLRYLFPVFPYHELEIADTKKPFLPSEAFHFSISHCGDFAAVIVSTQNRVGIDIEIFTEKINKIATKFLHEDEIKNLGINLFELNSQQTALLTLLWSCKEAVFKWWGNGKVDFSEMIRIQPFTLYNEGIIDVHFKERKLQLEYKLLNKMYLVWVKTENGNFV